MTIPDHTRLRMRKLAKMTTREIGDRIGQSLRRRRERREYREHLPATNGRCARPRVGDDLTGGCLRLVTGCSREQLSRLKREHRAVFAALSARTAARARAVLSGACPILGHAVDLRAGIDWHLDPRSEYRWPRCFYADVSLGQDADGGVDVKYIWELGRQQYVVDLAQGWHLARQECFAERARALLLDWVRCNPVYEGVHWTSALEVAMRAISWIWTLAALAEWDGWQTGDLERVGASLADHARYLGHHFSFYSSPYNHLIGEATGLYLVGLALREFGESEHWRRRAREVLIEHGPRQFYGDGFTVEQATGYHFYTLGFLSLAIAAARVAGEPFDDLEEVTHRAYRAGAAFQQPDGRWPAVGDVDSARSIPVHHDDFWDFRSLMSLGAGLFDDPELKACCDVPGEELYWLLGCEGVGRWHRLPEKPAPSRVVLGDSGYAVARSGGDWLLFDAGPIGAGVHSDATPSTAHGHADALQVLFCMDGKPVLVDAGIPFYFGPIDWVRHFRGPAAHNTLEIEDVEMAHNAGRLDWSHVADRPQLDANLSDDVWLARGRAEWSPGVIVERNLLMIPGRGLWVADYIQTDRPRRVRWFWHLPANTVARVEQSDPTTCLITGDEISLASWSTAGPLRAGIDATANDSPIAWKAIGYGVCVKGQRARIETEVSGRLLLATYVGPEPMPVEVVARGLQVLCAGRGETVAFADRHNQLHPAPATGDIVWRVLAEEGVLTVVAGPSAWTASGWSPLDGVGDWEARYEWRPPAAFNAMSHARTERTANTSNGTMSSHPSSSY